jgi:hypothetical protein
MAKTNFDIKKLGKELKNAAQLGRSSESEIIDQVEKATGQENVTTKEEPVLNTNSGENQKSGENEEDQFAAVKNEPVVNTTPNSNNTEDDQKLGANPRSLGLKTVPNLTADNIEFFINQVKAWERPERPKNDTKSTIQLDPHLYALLAQIRLATKIPGIQFVNYLITEFFRNNPDFMEYVQKKASSDMLGGADIFK